MVGIYCVCLPLELSGFYCIDRSSTVGSNCGRTDGQPSDLLSPRVWNYTYGQWTPITILHQTKSSNAPSPSSRLLHVQIFRGSTTVTKTRGLDLEIESGHDWSCNRCTPIIRGLYTDLFDSHIVRLKVLNQFFFFWFDRVTKHVWCNLIIKHMKLNLFYMIIPMKGDIKCKVCTERNITMTCRHGIWLLAEVRLRRW